MTKEIVLCFLDINSPALVEGSLLNKWAAKIAPRSTGHPKIHVELWFQDPQTETAMPALYIMGAPCTIKTKHLAEQTGSFVLSTSATPHTTESNLLPNVRARL